MFLLKKRPRLTLPPVGCPVLLAFFDVESDGVPGLLPAAGVVLSPDPELVVLRERWRTRRLDVLVGPARTGLLREVHLTDPVGAGPGVQDELVGRDLSVDVLAVPQDLEVGAHGIAVSREDYLRCRSLVVPEGVGLAVLGNLARPLEGSFYVSRPDLEQMGRVAALRRVAA